MIHVDHLLTPAAQGNTPSTRHLFPLLYLLRIKIRNIGTAPLFPGAERQQPKIRVIEAMSQ